MLSAGDAATGDDFGYSAALSGDASRAIVGVRRDGGSTGSARLFMRTGVTWVEVLTLRGTGIGTGDYFGEAVAIESGGARAIVGSDAIDGSAANVGGAWIFAIAPAVATGGACTADSQCASDFCTDGVCCDVRCGSGVRDCEACSAALTGGADGTCAPLSAAEAPAVVCRSAPGVCDVAETCSSTSRTCPTNLFAAAGTVCRPRDARACDADDVCTGAAAACPPDGPAGSGTICRPAAGGCDVQEVCDGVGFVCPGDVFAGAGVVCRSPGGTCDAEELCTGSSGMCPTDGFRLAGVLCRAAAGPCDVDESCSGTGAACPSDAFQPSTMVCDGAVVDVCDSPDHCTGSMAICPDEFLSGVECRAAADSCDLAESCNGTSASCPTDALVSAGIVCRAASMACDVAETCDGTSTRCPADADTCSDAAGIDAAASDGGAGTTDAAGSDGGSSGIDAGGTVADGGAPPPGEAGCACRAGRAPAPGTLATVVALYLIARVGRRDARARRS